MSKKQMFNVCTGNGLVAVGVKGEIEFAAKHNIPAAFLSRKSQ